VETGFMKAEPKKNAKLSRAQKEVARREIPDSWIPRKALPIEEQIAFLPVSADGRLHPARRYVITANKGLDKADEAANPKRILPRSFALALSLVDGKRSVGEIGRALRRLSPLPGDVLEGQLFRLLKDLAVLGAIAWTEKPDVPLKPEPAPGAKDAWAHFRLGEEALRRGDPSAAEEALTRSISLGAPGPWTYALRGEARRHLGRKNDAARDLDAALALCEPASKKSKTRLDALRDAFEAGVERAMLEDRVRLLRGKLRLVSGDAAGAREDADAALKLNPRQSEALVVRAKAAMALGDLLGAKADLAAALRIETAGKRHEG
jgi:hypothetical protein